MIILPYGCRCSELSVSPADWLTTNTLTDWSINYRFYDPGYEEPKQVRIRSGINLIKDLDDRRELVKKLKAEELYKLKELAYNPITGAMVQPVEIEYEIHPDTSLNLALEQARLKLDVVPEMMRDIKSAVKTMDKACKLLRYDTLAVSKTSLRHLMVLMERCGEINKKWSNNRHNKFRSYLIMLFKKLVKYEAIAANPAYDLDIKNVTKKIRDVLTPANRQEIKEHLNEKSPPFLMFLNLFFHSGGRKKELLQLKPGKVDLKRQKYRTIVKKGKKYVEVERTIKDVALPYWRYFLEQAKDGEFLFCVGFKPGEKAMAADTIGRWWHRLVKAPKHKGGLGINVDFYLLKHLHTTEIMDMLESSDAAQIAAGHNAHTTEAMVVSIYDKNNEERRHNRIKRLGNEF